VVLLIWVIVLCILLAELYIAKYSVKQPIELFQFPHYSPRTKKQEEEVRNGVPLVIYESWKSHDVPEGMRDNILRLLKMNPEFDYYLYSDEECAAFIADNYDQDVVAAFHMLKPGAYKSDLWRYCILYKLGGVYLDIKYYSTVPLISIIDENPTVFIKDDGAQWIEGNFFGPECLYNGFMVSPPKNEVFKLCIDEIVESCKSRLYRNNMLDITGPCLLGRIVRNKFSQEYMNNIPFVFNALSDIIVYKDTIILRQYHTYREEQQRMFKGDGKMHYSRLYKNKQVYQ
jgi:mannosyltransferase OCH1-like enzyme